MKTPRLDSLSMIQKDGSRRFVHPSDVKGFFIRWRKLAAVLLVVIYVLLPWIPVNGYPSVFLDVQQRRFHFFGLTLATQDLWVGFFLITGLAFSLFYITALFGRIWCGWACPYTVFLEHVFRRIERWIEGDATARRQLDAASWSADKLLRRGLKHTFFILASALIAHIFLSYFVSLKQLYLMMKGSPLEHATAFSVVAFLTGALYFAFSWFREQFCIILCPYGRLQSALTDEHSVVIGYDTRRGEPRGKAKEGVPAGDCVDCRRCVQVCPTGIDIRNGLQLECIGCAACVDACDTVMVKLQRTPGLIRYDSQTGLQGGRTRYSRPRIWFYTLLLCLGIGAFATSAMHITPLHASAVRMIGHPYFLAGGQVRNHFQIRIINKRTEAVNCSLSLIGQIPAGLHASGLNDAVPIAPLGEEQKTVVLALPEADFKGSFRLIIKVTDNSTGNFSLTRELEFLGPDSRLKNTSLHVEDYLQ